MVKKLIVSLSALALVVAPAAAAPATRTPGIVVNPHTGETVADVVIPPHAIEAAPNIFSLGFARDVDGTLVEGYAIVHKKSDVRSNATKGPRAQVCYSFLASGARWKTTEPYLFNAANSDGLVDTTLETELQTSIDEWDDEVAFDLFGIGALTSETLSVETSAPDGLNEVFFGAVGDPNTIAVTTTWGIFGGSPSNRRLVEWDMVFNDPDFDWGDATVTPAVMDLKNIAVHELGHAAGLGHPSDSCSDETMYRFATEGEIKKRDLFTGDIAGIKKLYQ